MKTKLRELAKRCPHCMGCGLENPNGDLLCLAHSNEQADGRGAYHKSNDLYGAYLCHRCHQYVDVTGKTKEEKRAYHKRAWLLTIRWWINNGFVKPS